ncbi:multidrug ABC transporter ATP-binding protein [Sphaerisporangium siamense]|uniref:Putative ABC transport system ATP-binding protein n=1 Tax=Sphaerisporangium siamense TaxID=795645 RepID=A0A7W7GC58_9ACTN|nr:ABC transporter ATP-binding protein [Sphaerisporangium siamense]MBB4704212.1 putative ABC transport system ATP-binding protein [Sphaerisporangium siamense]GII85106.1 multidrug ABC transporter ATP-binding protein [Sphaerisporangium siamense]
MGTSGRQVLARSIKGQWRGVATGSALGCAHQAGEALVPVLIGVVVDQAVAKGDAGALLWWLAVLAVVYVALSFGFRFGARAGERAAEQAAHLLRVALVQRVLHPGGGAETGRPPGALTSIATEDARRVGAVNMAVILGVAALAGVLVGAVALLRTSVPLGLTVLAGTPVLLWLGHLLSKPLERRSEAEQERAAHASGVAADLVAGLRVLKGLGAEAAAVARYRRTSRASLAATLRATRAEAVQNGVVVALTGVFIAVVALVGGRLAAQGDISLGQLVSAVGLALFLIGPLETFSWVNAELAQGRASAARVAAVLSAPPAVSGGAWPPASGPVRGTVRMRGVVYGGLRGLDLDVAAGEILGVAATGPSDATALLRLLDRRADPDEGVVELDGVPLCDLDPAGLRTALLVAEHDAELFAGTLHENVTAPGASEARQTMRAAEADVARVMRPVAAEAEVLQEGHTVEAEVPQGMRAPEVEWAMRAAAADEVAQALPDGAASMIGERGRSLSGGQRQRVALARALAARRPVLVLHDPTTAVDAVTEARVAAGIRETRAGRTTILVTTSPALLAAADRVVLVHEGRVTASAPHAELLRHHAPYRTAVLA